MGSTYLSLNYHIVFSTKNRQPLIIPEWRPRLHDYLGGTVRGLGGTVMAVGGVEDHVHLLVGLRATHRLSDVLRDIKKASSMWVHEEIKLPAFAWQEGYSAFTVSASAIGSVRRYILNQETHHARTSFRDELMGMLTKAGTVYDPQYLE